MNPCKYALAGTLWTEANRVPTNVWEELRQGICLDINVIVGDLKDSLMNSLSLI